MAEVKDPDKPANNTPKDNEPTATSTDLNGTSTTHDATMATDSTDNTESDNATTPHTGPLTSERAPPVEAGAGGATARVGIDKPTPTTGGTRDGETGETAGKTEAGVGETGADKGTGEAETGDGKLGEIEGETGETAKKKKPSRYAYVELVMKGDSYVIGALVSAFSIKQTGTPHDLVCMVTPEVSPQAREHLLLVFDHVVEVPMLTYEVKALRTEKQRDIYKTWADSAFTKWNMLSLKQYEKVLFVDADKIVLSNVDHLFGLATPAATFSSPWVRNHPYEQLLHGQAVPRESVQKGLDRFIVIIGTMVLLAPSDDDFTKLQAKVVEAAPFGYQNCNSMMDEQSLTAYYHDKGTQWTYIHQQFNYIPWKHYWLKGHTPSTFHYFNKPKPWEEGSGRREWLDLEAWWTLALALAHRHPPVKALLDPKNADMEALPHCAWCKESFPKGPRKEEYKTHPVFSKDGTLCCPLLMSPPVADHYHETAQNSSKSRGKGRRERGGETGRHGRGERRGERRVERRVESRVESRDERRDERRERRGERSDKRERRDDGREERRDDRRARDRDTRNKKRGRDQRELVCVKKRRGG